MKQLMPHYTHAVSICVTKSVLSRVMRTAASVAVLFSTLLAPMDFVRAGSETVPFSVAGPQGGSAPCGPAGTLDPAFGSGGKVSTDFNQTPDQGYSMAIQSDGKIVVAGQHNTQTIGGEVHFALARYNANGTLDTSFGTGGKVTTHLGGISQGTAFAVAIQSDGKIVAAGRINTGAGENFALVRYNPNGSLDTSFGSGGIVTTNAGGSQSWAYAVAVLADGKVVAAGFSNALPGRSVLIRNNADGSLDSGFGTGGIALGTAGGGTLRSVVIQPDGKIVAAGWADVGAAGAADILVARYNADGSPDPLFGTGGYVQTGVGSLHDQAYSVALQPDGRIVVAGFIVPSAGAWNSALVRYNSDGTLDSAFGTDGKVVTSVGLGNDGFRSVALQSDGKLVAGGYRVTPMPNNVNLWETSIVRYDANGSLDGSFGSGGIAATSTGNNDSGAFGLGIAADGRIIAVSSPYMGNPQDNNFALARFLDSGCDIAVEQPAGTGLQDGSSTIDFGTQVVGTGVSKTFTIRNNGTEALTIGPITVNGTHGSEFVVDTAATAASVAPGSSTTFAVTFTPTAAGPRNAALQIDSGDAVENPFDINLMGRGNSGVMYALTVTAVNGTVTSSPAGINCPVDCAESLDEAATITLHATPNVGYRFIGWSGSATGNLNPLTVTMNGNKSMTAVFDPLPPLVAPFDFDGDGFSDMAVRRSGNNTWYLQTGEGFYYRQYGISNDRLAPADYDGDGETDIAVFRPSTGQWNILRSLTQTIQTISFGVNGDLPLPADRNSDGVAELVVYRPSNRRWYTRFSGQNIHSQTFGEPGDKPVMGDFDADGQNDLAVFRPSNNVWYINATATGFYTVPWGAAGDIPVPADYDGDRRTDIAVYRPSIGRWYVIGSTAGWIVRDWGEATDIPVPADYDADGRADLAVFRPSNGTWYVINSTTGAFYVRQFGQDGDVPIPSAFVY